jgi:hypothetical protein
MIFIGHDPGFDGAKDPDRAEMDDAAHAGPPGGSEHIFCANDIDFAEHMRIGHDRADRGGQMENDVNADHRPFQSRPIQDITAHRSYALNFSQGRLVNNGPDIPAFGS